jgi:hypothetical protein
MKVNESIKRSLHSKHQTLVFRSLSLVQAEQLISEACAPNVIITTEAEVKRLVKQLVRTSVTLQACLPDLIKTTDGAPDQINTKSYSNRTFMKSLINESDKLLRQVT